MTLKEELAIAQARVSTLEGELSSAKQTNISLEAEKNELSGKLTAAETKVSEQDEIAASNAKEAADKIVALSTRAETAEKEASELKEKAQTVEEKAEVKAREIAARNGANLPEKKPGAGDTTTDDAKRVTGSPRERLAAVFQSRLTTH